MSHSKPGLIAGFGMLVLWCPSDFTAWTMGSVASNVQNPSILFLAIIVATSFCGIALLINQGRAYGVEAGGALLILAVLGWACGVDYCRSASVAGGLVSLVVGFTAGRSVGSELLGKWLLVSVILEIAVGLAQFASWSCHTVSGEMCRVSGSVWHVVVAGHAFAIAGLWGANEVHRSNAFAGGALLLLSSGGILLAGSRTGALALAVGVFSICLLNRDSLAKGVKWGLCIVALSTVCATLYCRSAGEVSASSTQASNLGRGELLIGGLNAASLVSHGMGPGMTGFKRLHVGMDGISSLTDSHDPKNALLELVLMFGWLGVAIVLVVLAGFARLLVQCRSCRSNSFVISTGLLVFVIGMLDSPILMVGRESSNAWIGLVAGYLSWEHQNCLSARPT